MIKATYQQLIERIAKLSGLPIEEIQRRVEAKKAKLSGLISDEGAAQVVASELKISFDKQQFKITDLLIGMKKIQVVGKIIEIYPIKKYRKGSQEYELASFLLADDSGAIRVVLWDTHHIELIKSGVISKDSVIEIKNADVRGGNVKELHLNSNSTIELSNIVLDRIVEQTEKPKMADLDSLNVGEQATIKANILQIFQPAFFLVCPECGMKVSYEANKAMCVRHGEVIPKKRAIVSFIIDDGTENMRATAFSEVVTTLFNVPIESIDSLQDSAFFLSKKEELLGTEWFFSGKVRKNILFNRNEFIINSVEPVDVEEMVKLLSD